MILSFQCKETEKLFNRIPVPRWSNIERAARRKLEMLDAAKKLDDLKAPPANRLEKLKADRAGQYSIRVNDQFRLCFIWGAHGVENVELVDYH